MSFQQSSGPNWGSDSFGEQGGAGAQALPGTEAHVFRATEDGRAESRRLNSERRLRSLLWIVSAIVGIVVVAALMMFLWSTDLFI